MRFYFVCLLALLAPGALFAPAVLAEEDRSWWQQAAEDFDVTGFAEVRLAPRLQSGEGQRSFTLGETRLQIEAARYYDTYTLNLTADFIYDAVAEDHTFGFEGDSDVIDLRSVNVEVSPFEFIDIKLGRQILTWGTGDLVFINDLFPKDWRSFLLGRDDEYLKAPANALKASLYFDQINIDLVYMPEFIPDRYINGSRVSFFDQQTAGPRGRKSVQETRKPGGWFKGDELSLRLYRSVGAFEVAAYFYDGYWKSPAGIDESGRATFPKLGVYGASVRGPAFGGIAHAEFGYYDSERGTSQSATLRGDEFKALTGFERDLGNELTFGLQYLFERKLNFDQDGETQKNLKISDRNRHLLTLRLTKQYWQQTLTVSAFAFYSPSDHDGHLRFNVVRKLSDALKVELGLNWFFGRRRDSFFGQFQSSSNVMSALRYSF